jgi:HSP20 family protein
LHRGGPGLDVFEDDSKIIVQLEVAGMKKEDVDISLHDGVLTISGERTSKGEPREGESLRSERSFEPSAAALPYPLR